MARVVNVAREATVICFAANETEIKWAVLKCTWTYGSTDGVVWWQGWLVQPFPSRSH